MKLLVMAVRDKRVEAFITPPMFARAKGEAIRWFMDTLSDPNTAISKHPGDFDLYAIAEFDDNTGKFSQDDSLPLCLMTGLEVSASKAQG